MKTQYTRAAFTIQRDTPREDSRPITVTQSDFNTVLAFLTAVTLALRMWNNRKRPTARKPRAKR